MDFLVNLTGRNSNSYWLAIVMISLIVKLITWPLSVKQFRSLKETQKLQPSIKELQAKYKNDRETLGRKTMELYQEHGINPMAGCAPMVIQLPIWYLLYTTIRIYEFQFQHGTFLWIGSYLSKLYPHIFAVDLDQPDIPLLGLYMLSMYIQQRMVVPPDPQQAEQQRMMAIWTPFMSGFIFLQGHWPSGFLLYYLVFNLLSMLQQKLYMRTGPADVAEPGPFDSVPSNTSTAGNGKRNGSSTDVDAAMENRAFSNGAKPAAKGAISPKIHPKKKRR
jgi:YidC/Oxa1 family membrane protein insertase